MTAYQQTAKIIGILRIAAIRKLYAINLILQGNDQNTLNIEWTEGFKKNLPQPGNIATVIAYYNFLWCSTIALFNTFTTLCYAIISSVHVLVLSFSV